MMNRIVLAAALAFSMARHDNTSDAVARRRAVAKPPCTVSTIHLPCGCVIQYRCDGTVTAACP